MNKKLGFWAMPVMALAFAAGCASAPLSEETVGQGKHFGYNAYQPYEVKSAPIDRHAYVLYLGPNVPAKITATYVQGDPNKTPDLEERRSSEELGKSHVQLRYRVTVPGIADNGSDPVAASIYAASGKATDTTVEAERAGISMAPNYIAVIYWLPPGERAFVLNEEHWQTVGLSPKAGNPMVMVGGHNSMVDNEEIVSKEINLEAGHYYYLRNNESNSDITVSELTRNGGSLKMWDAKNKAEIDIPMSAIIDGIQANVDYLKGRGR